MALNVANTRTLGNLYNKNDIGSLERALTQPMNYTPVVCCRDDLCCNLSDNLMMAAAVLLHNSCDVDTTYTTHSISSGSK